MRKVKNFFCSLNRINCLFEYKNKVVMSLLFVHSNNDDDYYYDDEI